MDLLRFLTFPKSRRYLTLSKSSKTKHIVPRLQTVILKVIVHISDDTLLEYQHDLRTNSKFFHINLTLDPKSLNVSSFQQYFIVNCLCDEFMLEVDYDQSILAEATRHSEKEALLVEHAESICNEKLSRELKIAEKLLDTDKAEFFTSVAKKVDKLLDRTVEPESVEAGDIPLVEKSSNVYLEWFSLIEPCIKEFVEKARISNKEFDIENPFELIDLEKARVLGALFGEIYEGTSQSVPYSIQKRKYHVGSVRICPSPKISDERIKRCLVHCAASFFVNAAKSPFGLNSRDSASDLQQKYTQLTKEYYEIVESIERDEKIANARQARKNAELLVQELGSEAERLKLALDQGIDLIAIYYDTLTNYIRGEIEISLRQALKDLYGCGDVDVSSSIRFIDGDFAQRGKTGAINSPELLTLRVSQIVKEYFNSHPWLSRLSIKNPEIKMLVAYETDHNGSETVTSNEVVLIRDYLYGQFAPGGSEMLININKIVLGPDQENEMISLQQL